MSLEASEWWRGFFSGPAAEAQRRLYSSPERTRQEADFLADRLGLAPGARVLDVPCGTGRLSLELAARGHRLTGVDLSAEILGDARRTSAERGLDIAWEHRDMRDLPWSHELDAAFCLGNSFGYMDEAANAEFLRAVARNLRPGGSFLLETGFVAESVLPNLQARRWFPLGDHLFLLDTHYEPAAGRLITEYTFVQGADITRRTASYRIYTYRQIADLFTAAGFVDVEGYGSLAAEPYRVGMPTLYLRAVVPAP